MGRCGLPAIPEPEAGLGQWPLAGEQYREGTRIRDRGADAVAQPKAWLASASGIGAYTSANDLQQILLFAALYLPICWLSLACWVYAGAFLRRHVQRPVVLVTVNRILALLLAASCLYLLIG